VDPRLLTLRSPGETAIAALLWDAGRGTPAVAVVHGAGSRKENHRAFGRACAEAGVTALAIDLRGHGASGGAPGAGMVDDVLVAVEELERRGAPRVGIRGTSLGGFLALHAAGRHGSVAAVAALCPARPVSLARIFEDDWPLGLPPLEEVVVAPGPARGYLHATGDEQVPWSWSWRLHDRSPAPRMLRVRLGGGHRGLGDDPWVRAESLAFLLGHLGSR
jgi:uncharacterized protein